MGICFQKACLRLTRMEGAFSMSEIEIDCKLFRTSFYKILSDVFYSSNRKPKNFVVRRHFLDRLHECCRSVG